MPKAKTTNVVFGVQRQRLTHLTKKEYLALRELTYLAKNMYNVALYQVRQYFFTERKYLTYESNYHLCKDNENFQLLNSNMAQQILKVVDRNFRSFFALHELAREGRYQYQDIQLPRYLPKEGYFNLIFAEFNVAKGIFQVPMSPVFRKTYGKVTIRVPSNLKGKPIKEIRILPKHNARSFELHYVYEVDEVQKETNPQHLLALDLGVNNLATGATHDGDTFIIDGKRLKAYNQWANKDHSRLQRINDKQKREGITQRQERLWQKRNRRVNDYINKAARNIIRYCLDHQIGTLVVGYHPTIQKNVNLGRHNNQNFVNIPIGQLRTKLEQLCKRYDIHFKEQEESYTSQASFLDNDQIPVYDLALRKRYTFSGKRIKRGLYQTKDGVCINADVNGAFNILRKAGVSTITVDKKRITPQRILIA